jgi:riboflavin synthase
MFTGLVESLGTVDRAERDGSGYVLSVSEPNLAAHLSVGESVAVNGVCLTVVGRDSDTFRFQVGPETLRCTNLGELQRGDRVNLERALAAGDRLGGHIVQGHIDGVGRVARRQRRDEWEMVWFDCPAELARFMAPKGSVAVDGVSLTLVDVAPAGFSVALIPHTLAQTTLGFKQPPASVNLETDLFAKYIWSYLNQLGEGWQRSRDIENGPRTADAASPDPHFPSKPI